MTSLITTANIATIATACAALAGAFSGFAFLGLALDRHWADIHGRGSEPSPSRRRQLRWCGAGQLLLSLLACLALRGNAQGWVLWLGALTAAGWMAVLILTYAARRLPGSGMAAASLALLSGGAALLMHS
jgi:hypothetical protein